MMKSWIFLALLVGSIGLGSSKPSVLGLPTLLYASHGNGAPVGADGRVVDTAEVALAKLQHAAAHLNERAGLANEVARSGEVSRLLVSQTGIPLLGLTSILSGRASDGAPVGADGRVVDTPEVARAKAEHAIAHLNEKFQLSNEATRNSGLLALGPSALALRV